MNILVIGGTRFIGRHVVHKLLEAGHTVTLLNRGISNPGLFPNLTTIKADRDSDDIRNVPELRRTWDSVIDLCAYYPKGVDAVLKVLNGCAGRYIQCSSVSAYLATAQEDPTPILHEDDPLRTCSEPEATDTTMSSYGQRKAECERVAMAQHSSGIPVIILRPSLVFGAHDQTDRFAYWIWRAANRSPYILPDEGLTITRRTYAPDLATAFVSAINSHQALGNAYNIAETDPLSFRDTLYHLGNHLGTDSLRFGVSVSSDFLLKNNVAPWSDIPLWIPKTNLLADTYKSRKDLGFVSTPATRALAEAADAFLSEKRTPKAGLSVAREQELLRLTNSV
ncbi:MAG: hypothetical protein A2603_14485 [Bdellovibrionales bacterium RIFOXYD1_FULL_55_31]|nr:MAG: hypothetical protein A2603_14485 [Bdellovibrionales bacterium RIFOXYD1_FULL_55_31]